MAAIFIVCPANFVTGGTELMHQLAGSLTAEGITASILYYPFSTSVDVPEAFRRYGVQVARYDQLEPADIVIIPEIYPNLVRSFPKCRRYLWWMSVDNMFLHLSFSKAARILPGSVHRKWHIGRLREKVDLHLYQSDYAREFLAREKLGPSAALSDYLASEYLDRITHPPTVARENLVVFNPEKGAEFTSAIMDEFQKRDGGDIRFVPLRGMGRDQVTDLLSRAKLYIDFGNHPGKDRIPREAVAMGACILVNRRGSAGNDVDIPIADFYKVDDSVPGFAGIAVDRIMEIIRDFAAHSAAFLPYRQVIRAGPDRFIADMRSIFSSEA